MSNPAAPTADAPASACVPAPLPAGAPAPSRLPAGLGDPLLDTPCLLIDLDILASNLMRMAALASRSRVRLRPHAKTHKSLRIARMQIDAGAAGICVATVGEAEVMRGGGIEDILIAYNIIGQAKLSRLLPLCAGGGITLIADSVAVAEGYSRLARTAGQTQPVLLEIDSGMKRTGIPPGAAGEIGSQIASLPGIELTGILTHAGHAHDMTDQPDIEAVARDEANAMQQAIEELSRRGIEVQVVSAGSTITAPYLTADDGITEIRPGTYAFNDLRTLEMYACTPDQIAATILATVVSVSQDHFVLDAGNKTLTMTSTRQHGHGKIKGHPRSSFLRLSEEHGVAAAGDTAARLRVGDRVEILPVHICVCVDLQQEAYGLSRGTIAERIRIDAARRSR
jgi:D-serine deaminase-like pyridoxal phosphate-dependent protein